MSFFVWDSLLVQILFMICFQAVYFQKKPISYAKSITAFKCFDVKFHFCFKVMLISTLKLICMLCYFHVNIKTSQIKNMSFRQDLKWFLLNQNWTNSPNYFMLHTQHFETLHSTSLACRIQIPYCTYRKQHQHLKNQLCSTGGFITVQCVFEIESLIEHGAGKSCTQSVGEMTMYSLWLGWWGWVLYSLSRTSKSCEFQCFEKFSDTRTVLDCTKNLFQVHHYWSTNRLPIQATHHILLIRHWL